MSNEDQSPVAEPEKTVNAGRSSSAPERVHGLGRRKTAVARVHLRPGAGNWTVNGRTLQDYFPRGILQQGILRPFVVTETEGRYDVLVRVAGGGLHGQADAVRLGLARALLKIDESFRPRLRAEALLTRDAREVERKKPGRPKARKRFQFSKR
jgi:small subunit ribosomal protein S9